MMGKARRREGAQGAQFSRLIDITAFDPKSLLYLKKIPTLYSVDIEADKICQTKKKNDTFGSENQKQSFRFL